MIMEFAEGGELFNHIINQGNLSEKEARSIFQQIIDTIDYIHRIGICHRDLKPENILFDYKERKRIKIIDFGLSNLYNVNESSNTLETPCGSPGYAPPEMILGSKYQGIMTDIWSSGIILYAMLCGCLPFDDYSEEKLYSKIIKGNFDYPPFLDISKEAKQFINSMLVVNPKYRITISEIKKNNWFLKDYKPTLGLYVSIYEIPVSNIIVEEMKKLGYDERQIYESVKNNNHDNLTTIYYLLVKKKYKEGIGTESDLISNKFQEYIKEMYQKIGNGKIKPLSLKNNIVSSKKYLCKNEEMKKTVNKILDSFEKNINTERIITNNLKEEKNMKVLNKKKNRTVSNDKSKHSKINKIQINNIKNIHYININDIKANILMKTCDKEYNKIKFFKKIVQITKSRKDNSKNKRDIQIVKPEMHKLKEVHFINYIKFKNSIRNKRDSKEKISRKDNNKKNNITVVQEPISNNRTSINNCDYKESNSLSIEKRLINKENKALSKILKNKNIQIHDDLAKKSTIFIQNIKCLKKSNITKRNNNSKNNYSKNEIKFDLLSKMTNIFNGVRTSRIRPNMINSVSNSKIKSKNDRKTRSSSSNSNSGNNILQKEKLSIFKTSRNNNNIKYNLRKNVNKTIKTSNFTQEKNINKTDKTMIQNKITNNNSKVVYQRNTEKLGKDSQKFRKAYASEQHRNITKKTKKNKINLNKKLKLRNVDLKNKTITESNSNSLVNTQTNNTNNTNINLINKKMNKNIFIKINDEKKNLKKNNKLTNKTKFNLVQKKINPFNIDKGNNRTSHYINRSDIIDEQNKDINKNKSNNNIIKCFILKNNKDNNKISNCKKK